MGTKVVTGIGGSITAEAVLDLWQIEHLPACDFISIWIMDD